MEHPDLHFVIQESRYNDRLKAAMARQRIPPSHRVSRFRVIAGTTLMAIGARVAAMPRPANAQQTLSEIPVVNSIRNA